MPRHRTATPAARAKRAPCEHVAELVERQVTTGVELLELEVDEDAEAELIGQRCDRVRTQVDDGQGGTRLEADGEILARIPELRPERPAPQARAIREARQVRVEVERNGERLWRCAKCNRWVEAEVDA